RASGVGFPTAQVPSVPWPLFRGFFSRLSLCFMLGIRPARLSPPDNGLYFRLLAFFTQAHFITGYCQGCYQVSHTRSTSYLVTFHYHFLWVLFSINRLLIHVMLKTFQSFSWFTC